MKNNLVNISRAKFVRFQPTEFFTRKALRVELYGILKPSGNVIIYITVYYRQTDNPANLKYLRRHIVLGPYTAISKNVVEKVHATILPFGIVACTFLPTTFLETATL